MSARRAGPRIGLVSAATDLGVMVVRSLLVKLLREKHPDARIVLLTEARSLAWAREFYERCSWVDACVPLPTERPRGRLEWLRLWWRLRAERLDVAVLNPLTRFPAELPYWCGVPVRVGLGRDARGNAWLTRVVRVAGLEQRDLHWTRVIEGYARALELDYRGAAAHVPFVKSPRAGTTRAAGGRSVVVHLGGNPAWNRRWPRARFEGLCARLAREDGTTVTLLGGRDDAPDNRAVVAAVRAAQPGARIEDASGAGVEDTIARVAAADLFVGNDSGPMNIAVAVGTPIVAVRGADPENFRADLVDPRHVVFSAWSRCSRRETGSEHCALGCPVAYDREAQTYPRCMESIAFESVWEAVQRRLAAGAGRS